MPKKKKRAVLKGAIPAPRGLAAPRAGPAHPVLAAARAGDAAKLRALVAEGADLNVVDSDAEKFVIKLQQILRGAQDLPIRGGRVIKI